MPLLRSPRTSFDLTIDLNVTDIRTYNSTTYYNKHIRIIPKTSIDTARGLVFWSAASVTIIGGHFRPAPKAWGYNAENGTGSKAPATMNFNNCGAVYLEGILIDNANLIVTDPAGGENGGDAVFLSGKNANTNLVVQNCAWINVRGVQTLPNGGLEAHGDIFQTGSRTQGLAGDVLFYNFTGSGDYQGFFLDPQTRPPGVTDYPDGGMASLTLQRVNLKRTAQKTSKHQLLFLFSSEAAYEQRGYPANFTDVWLDGLPGDTLEDTIWPRNGPSSNGQFTNVKYQADIVTDGSLRYAEWPRLRTAGKFVVGRVYQGSPPTGDYCPTDRIGLGYVQGTDLEGGSSPTSARRSFQTESGKAYTLSFTSTANPCFFQIGYSPKGEQLVAQTESSLGANSVSFVAAGSITHVLFQRTLAGSSGISGLFLTASIWLASGPGTVSNPTDTSLTITAVGGTPTIAKRVLTTEPGQRYTVTWVSDSATGTWAAGSTLDGTEISDPGPSFVVGSNSAVFIATTPVTYFRFQRTGAGVVNLSGFSVQITPVLVWTSGGAGTVTIPNDGQVTLSPSGSASVYARRTFNTVQDRKYSFDVAVTTNAALLKIGTTAGGGELLPNSPLPIAPVSGIEFVSDTPPTHVEISRSATGSSTLTGLTLTQLSTHAWYSGGPGQVTVTNNTALVIEGAGTTATFAHRPIATIADREYLWTFTSSGGAPTRQVGSGFGGSNLSAVTNVVSGENTVRFAALSHQAWLRIQQVGASSPISISNVAYSLLPFDSSVNWTISGTGTTSIDANQAVTINGNGTTATAARRAYNTIVGKAYELLFNVTGQPCAYYVGSSDGGSQIVAQTTGNPGTVSVKFIATTATTFLSVQRTGTGATVVTKPAMSVTTLSNTVSATVASFNDTNLGGIGKPYYFVDRLSDSATDGTGNRGSLRFCLTNNIGDNRLILPEIQGVLNRTADLGIQAGRNNVTIAGYTGPGPIVQRGSWNFTLRGQNNVVEHMAFEREYNDRGASNGDGLQIVSSGGREVRNILVRNCYTAHSQDEAFQIYQSRTQADNESQHDISLHWNVFTNPLKDPKEYNSAYLSNLNVDAVGQDGDHNFNILIGGYIFNVDVQRNIMANAKQRNPRFSAPHTNSLVANNVIVNWGYGAIGFQSEQDDYQQTNNPAGSLRYKISVIGNIGIPGPDTTKVELISQHGGGRLGANSLIHISNNSIIQGLNAALTATANTIGFENASRAHYPEFPGIQASRQDTLLAVQAIAQAVLLNEMNLNVGPFPKLRAQNPNLLRGVTQALGQMNREIAGKHINHEAEGPGLSVVPTVSRPLTGNLAPPTDHTNVAQVQAWLRERRLEVAYD